MTEHLAQDNSYDDSQDNLKTMVEEFEITNDDENENTEMIDPERNYTSAPVEDEVNLVSEEPQIPESQVEAQGEAQTEPEAAVPTPPELSISLKSFKQWAIENAASLLETSTFINQDIRTPGVNIDNIVAFTLPIDGSDDVKEIFILKNCEKRRIPDVVPNSFEMINDTLIRIGQTIINDKLYLVSYSTENILVSILFLKVGERLIPYDILKLKKKDDALAYDITETEVDSEIELYQAKLDEGVDLETIHLLYKQSAKAETTFTIYQDFYDWVYEKYASIKDINHLLQIDKALISIFKDLR